MSLIILPNEILFLIFKKYYTNLYNKYKINDKDMFSIINEYTEQDIKRTRYKLKQKFYINKNIYYQFHSIFLSLSLILNDILSKIYNLNIQMIENDNDYLLEENIFFEKYLNINNFIAYEEYRKKIEKKKNFYNELMITNF